MSRPSRAGFVGIALGAVLSALWPLPLPAATPPVDPRNALSGWWEPPFDWGSPAIHMAILKGTGTHTQVVFWGRGHEGKVWRMNPLDSLGPGSIAAAPTNNSNIFCAGHSVLPNGNLLVTGGNEFSDIGLEHVNLFSPASAGGWMSPRPRNMVESRYYPTNTTLSDGTVLVAGGRSFQEFVAFGGVSALAETKDQLTVLGLRGLPQLQVANPAGPPPPARSGHTMIFDSGDASQTIVGYEHRQRIVLYGGAGSSGAPLSDVWTLERTEQVARSWIPLNPAPDPTWGAPPARSGHTAVYDEPDSSMVIFGGRDAGGAPLDDAWKLYLHRGTDGAWSKLSPSGGDSTLARFEHTAVVDTVGRRLLVFGGRRGAELADATVWSLSLSGAPAWAPVAVAGTPPAPREGHAAVYDTKPGRSRMILFGGNDDVTLYNDLWTLDFQAPVPQWAPLYPQPDPAHGTASPRTGATMTHDTNWDRLLIFGGDDNGAAGGGALGDLWHVNFGTAPPVANAGRDRLEPRHPEPPASLQATPTWVRLYADLAGDGVADHAAVFDPRWLNSTLPELFYPDQDFWLPLYSARRWEALYPFHFLLPSGKVFSAGPAFFTAILNLEQGAWETYPWAFSSFRGGSAVQYRPGKIMKCGDQGVTGLSNTAIIDLSGDEASAQWIDLTDGPPMTPRVEHNLTILPTGQVLLTGGLSQRLDITTADRRPQLWDPNTLQWSDSTLLAPDPIKRDYHSSINLLPDGRLLSGGGELRFSESDHERFTGTIYWPPYLFDATGALASRPVITSAPEAILHGGTMVVGTPQADRIAGVCLIRPGVTTHAFNQEQRYIPLEFTNGGGDGLIVDIPANANVVPRGNYLLFLVDQDSVPSVANWIRIGPGVSGTGESAPPAPVPELAVHPNPVRGAAMLEYSLSERAPVRLEIFDAAGRRVRLLADGPEEAGAHRVAWTARDDAGRSVAQGVYFARLQAGDRRSTAKLLVQRD